LNFRLLSATSRITDDFLRRCALAYATQAADVAAAWSPIYPEIVAPSVEPVGAASDLQDGDVPVLFTPTIDQPGDLAYHYLKQGRPYAVVLASADQPFPSVQQAGGHEINEALVDPLCHRYDLDGWAIEVHDQLQDDPVWWSVADREGPVLLSPFGCPALFRLAGRVTVPGEPFDSAGLLHELHAVRPGGYAQKKDGTEVYGKQWMGHPARKESVHGRRMKRQRARALAAMREGAQAGG